MFNIVNRGNDYSDYDELDSQSFDTIEKAQTVILEDILNAQANVIRDRFDPKTGRTSPTTLDRLKQCIERGLWEKSIIEVVQTKRPSLDDYSDETIQAAFDKWMEADRKQLAMLKEELGEE